MRPSLRAVPLLIAAASIAPLLLLTTPGEGTPLYAAREGLACANCHFDPNGGGPRNAFGFAFAKNRHSTETESEGMFKDLDLANKVSEQLPLYFGVNHRFMTLFDDNGVPPKGLDRSGFFDMESQIHLAFQPHSRLTLVYTTDGFGTDPTPRVTREAWGMIGLGSDHFLRAGVFRSPFGLRMDDHTVATRQGFTEFQSPRGFALPYDPRVADQGVELGGAHGDWSGRLAFTNGTSFPLGGARPHAQTFAGKLAYHDSGFESGLSGYDEWVQPLAAASSRVRASRWGYYLLTHRGQASLIGEVVAGTDRTAGSSAGPPYSRVNRLGWFVEGDYQVNRACNVRARFDRLEGNRAADLGVRGQSSYTRYALEGEIVPVPFAEIRWTLRLIDPSEDKTGAGVERETEKQGYIQVHFSY